MTNYLKLIGAFTIGFVLASITMCVKKNKELSSLPKYTKVDTLYITSTSTDTILVPDYKTFVETKIVNVVKYRDVIKEVQKIVNVNVPIEKDKIIYIDSNGVIPIKSYTIDTTINDRKITTKVALQGTLFELSTSVSEIEKTLPVVKKHSKKINSIGLRSGVIWDNNTLTKYKRLVVGLNITIQNVSVDYYHKHGIILGYNFKF